MSVSLIMMGAGDSTRFGLHVKKQWLRIDDMPLWQYITKKIALVHDFERVIVVGHKNEIFYMQKYDDFIFCAGGSTRQESLKNALLHVKSEYVLVSDVARACTHESLVKRVLDAKGQGDCIVPVLDIADTVHFKNEPFERNSLKRVQTPQLSNTALLKKALETNQEFTDDSSAILTIGGNVHYVVGDIRANKLTCKEDISMLKCLKKPSQHMFVGNGFDVHQFGEERPLILGGIKVHETMGLKAHSDGDVVVHALIDALLGAIGGGDIGEIFPDSDDNYKGISSMVLLERVFGFVRSVGYELVNCDITIIAQTPKLSSFKKSMQSLLAASLHVKPIYVNIKATTTEELGFVGRKEGIAALSNVCLKFYDWTN